MIEWLFIFKWSNILWLWDTHFNYSKIEIFFWSGGGGEFCIIKMIISIFDRFDWKKRLTCIQSLYVNKQNIICHINVISTILHLILFQKVQFFGIQKLYNTDEYSLLFKSISLTIIYHNKNTKKFKQQL